MAGNNFTDKIGLLSDNKVEPINETTLSSQINQSLVEENSPVDKEDEDATPQGSVSLFRLFRYSTCFDVLLLIVGTLGAIANGCALPLSLVLFTNIITDFSTQDIRTRCSNSTNDTLFLDSFYGNGSNVSNQTAPNYDQMRENAVNMSILATILIGLSYFQTAFYMMAAQRQSRLIRKKLYSSILRQDIGWFDTYKTKELTTRLTDDVNKIKEGFGDKLGNCIQNTATFFAGMIISFVKGWQLTLVILAVTPLLFVCTFAFTKILENMTKNELKSYAVAGSIADEVLTAVRTVFAFDGAKKEHVRYEKNLEKARITGVKKGAITGLTFGFFFMILYCSYALAFWYGWHLTTISSGYNAGNVLLVFFNVITAVFSLGNAAPFIQTLSNSKGAAFEVFSVIDRVPSIDWESEAGITPEQFNGNIEFQSVAFKYPARREVTVLDQISLKVEAGKTVALVGSSGCGKSTVVQLIQRFYDVEAGIVSIDGTDLRGFNLNWLRSKIGVVSQEPVLFALSIKQNIAYGKENATDEEIVAAAKNANAHDFIMQLPMKYETLVGDRGSQLSGGQKQRIAIARALVRNPRILLLDEATSALDNESESIVQAALDKASTGRTTVVIAHRLSTIRNVDLIYCLDKGQVAESGTHEKLMSLQGLYYSLVLAQETKGKTGQGPEKEQTMLVNAEKQEETEKSRKKSVTETDSEEADVKSDKENGEKDLPEPSLKSMFSLNAAEWHLILIGCLAAIVSGAVNPAFAIILSNVLDVFSKCTIDEQRDGIYLYCLMFIATGVTAFFSNWLMAVMFSISGENMTKRIRSRCFKAVLSQDLAWFDRPENNIGTLTTRLATEAASVQGATGVRLGNVLMNVANLGVGMVISFIYGWSIALLIIGSVPLLIIAGTIQTVVLGGFANKDKEILEKAGKITYESIGNIRTVALLNKERHFIGAYSSIIDEPHKREMKSANFSGFMVGVSNALMFYVMAATFVFGAFLLEKQLFGLTFQKIMLVFSCIAFGAQGVGSASAMLPDYAKAKLAIAKILDLLDLQTKINNFETDLGHIPAEDTNCLDTIQLEDVEFSYPNRPEVKVLNKMNLTIKKGQQIALVGSSGCGKSTVTQLLERYYDPDCGEIKLGEHSLRDINLRWLRSQIGIVSQEPILFDLSIRENIAYGDNSRDIPMDEIIEAAKKANCHDFITKLPQQYETNVGSKGTQLSGGQKQRVSIARALIRDPKILILDEATSALDTQSEKIVQEALEKAQEGRTCIVIAHRLSTVKKCDLICVFKDGQISEIGTHDELMKLDGFYAKLNEDK